MIGPHGEQVYPAKIDEVGHIHREGGASARMLACQSAIDPDVRIGADALEKKINAPAALGGVQREFAPIPCGAVAITMHEPTQASVVVPVMRDVHMRPRGGIKPGLREVRICGWLVIDGSR